MIRMLTSGELFEAVEKKYRGATYSRVQWILRTRRDIQPSAKFGSIAAYDMNTIDRVVAELREIDSKKKAAAK